MPYVNINSLWMKAALGIGISTAATVGIYYYYSYRKKLQQKPPTVWNEIGQLDEITFFPIKSCYGIDMDSAKCDVIGMRYDEFIDRGFALLDNVEYRLVTARTFPKLLKIKPKIFKNWINLSAPGMNDLEIHLDSIEKNDMIKTSIWGGDVQVTKCGIEYDKWFSKFIMEKDNGLVLVYYKFSEPTKPILKNLKTDSFLSKDTGSLHDASSYLLINQKSIDDLNTRLKDKVNHKQFRPNFLIKTNGPPYAEDNWDWIKIGDVIFRVVVPSYRCIFANINPFTSERNPDGEPLKTLKTYRIHSKSSSPRMGVQLGIRTEGTVHKGDTVYIGRSE